MATKKNRKKEYKLELKRQGLIKTVNVNTRQVSKVVAEKVSKAKLTLEEFSAISAVEGLRANLVETLYEAGIQSLGDFANHSEDKVLALKGIGPATIKKLKENGVSFQA